MEQDTLDLYIPQMEDLWFTQKMLSDPETMFYNVNWDVSSEGYHRDTGCVDFPKSQWKEWYAHWIGQEPKRFYAYVRRKADGTWIGEVDFHYNSQENWWEMGVVIYAPYRGMGYAVPALKLMLQHAFRDCKIGRIHNDFELSRNEVSAWKTHFSAGFQEISRENGWLTVMITREQWLQNEAANGTQDAQVLYELAMKHIYGNGVPEDNERALELLTKAHKLGHVEATYNLGICYHYGFGTEVNLKKAYALYLESAEAGYGKGMELVGRFYNRGIYVEKNREKAEYWLHRAIQTGEADVITEAEKELAVEM